MDPLATVAQLRLVTGAPWTDQPTADLMLAVASGHVRSYCGWSISREVAAQVVLDTDGGRVASVPCLHLTAVAEVRIADTPITDYTWSASGVLYRNARWPRGFRAVSVTYDGGYVDTPAEVVAVVCGLASRLALPAGVTSWTVGSQTVGFSGDAGPGLAAVDRGVLDRYRIAGG